MAILVIDRSSPNAVMHGFRYAFFIPNAWSAQQPDRLPTPAPSEQMQSGSRLPYV
jgi:hypothetical protein